MKDKPEGCPLSDASPRNGKLTRRQEEVLRRAVHGYSNRQIAELLQVSVKTVEAHKAKGWARLGIDNRVDFFRWALENGWLGKR